MTDLDAAVEAAKNTLSPEALLLAGPHPEGYGKVSFHRTDGQVVVIDNVKVDSVSAMAEPGGNIGADLLDDNIAHVPFVAYWTVDYRL